MRQYRKPSLSARRPERPAVFEEMLAAAKPAGITPRTPAVRGRACLPAGFTVTKRAAGCTFGRDTPETVVFNHPPNIVNAGIPQGLRSRDSGSIISVGARNGQPAPVAASSPPRRIATTILNIIYVVQQTGLPSPRGCGRGTTDQRQPAAERYRLGASSNRCGLHGP